jgi:HAMP domain-containing protein
LANSALRVQASCMAMGQAAGAAAALAARAGVTPASVPLAELRKTLTAHGAIVPTV